MKKLNVFFGLVLLTYAVCGQESACKETIQESLQKAAEILNNPESRRLWNISLNAPVLIINPSENKMYFTAIENGKVSPFKAEEWNNKVPPANSFFDYAGKRYVTIIYAALRNAPCEQRINLLCHEIFHTYQKSLGIENQSSVNRHMDEVQGRTLLQMEMKALQQALSGDSGSLRDALYIRTYRQSIYPDNNEDLYELNEGLAEYTGVKLSMKDAGEYIKNRLNYDITKGYTNAFGYFTGSAYAILLDTIYPQWRYDKDLTKGLIYLIKKEKPEYRITIEKKELDKLFAKYEYALRLKKEKEELDSFGDMEKFRELLKPSTSKLCLPNQRLSFTYNPNDRVITLDDAVLLRNMTIRGDWGQLTVKSGLIRKNNWSAFYLLPPSTVSSEAVSGDDYEIKLNPGWKVEAANGLFRIGKE